MIHSPLVLYDAKMKLAVIIPAAGKSTRYGERDKLAEDLDGRPLLLRTVEFFTKREDISQIIVVGPQQGFEDFSFTVWSCSLFPWSSHRRRWCNSYGFSKKWSQNGLMRELIESQVHDAARPALTNSSLKESFSHQKL